MDLSFGRLLTLLELLQAYRRLSAREIADRLQVDTRTVRRYVAGLQDMGIPVEGERGPAGGYRLRPGFRLPPLMFSNEEALAVVLGLLAAQRLGLLQQGSAVQGALAKLDRVLPDQLRGRVRAAQSSVALGSGQVARGSAEVATVLGLGSAAGDRLRARIRYRASGGRVTERLIDPYGVAFQSAAWYLVAWDHLRGELRTFRLDRVLDCEVTKEGFQRPAGFDVASHVQHMLATLPWPWNAEVLLETSLREARRRVSPTLGTLEQTPAGVLLRIGADELDWIARYLAGLDLAFTVIRPAALNAALSALAERLLARAQTGTAAAPIETQLPGLTGPPSRG
jgi:predicted DNA-binding transcriptional regulator YafY